MRTIIICFQVILLFSYCSPEKKVFHIPKGVINVRSGPGTNHGKVFKLNTGDIITEISRKTEKVKVGKWQGYWVNIEFNGQKGWVLSEFIKEGKPTESSPTISASDGSTAKEASPLTEKAIIGKWNATSADFCTKSFVVFKAAGKGNYFLDWREATNPDCGLGTEKGTLSWRIEEGVIYAQIGKSEACFKMDNSKYLSASEDECAIKDDWDSALELER